MRSALGLGLLALLSLSGCKQGVGDRCQVNSDCQDGLTCVLPPNGSPQTGGTCQPPGGIDASVDLLPTGDGGPTDGAPSD
jgi:hypothetical protein